ncbi:MAG: 16S rRNA (uracil(1498)-N(3))-methyltransferase [Erysipelotrichaceae bacterium]|nr:16S rRNA (uracil(1498)-N(3))-methyltransferase [Erysipelotrichaceae bacterium]
MQQFFVSEDITLNKRIQLDKDTGYQLKKVLRVSDGCVFRLADNKGDIWLCEYENGTALVKEKLDEDNELKTDVTAIVSLIKNDKMDFMIQKLTELGVKRIVPYKAYRSVVKEGKGNNKLERFQKISREAAEQCHRNYIPEICDYASLKDLRKYMSDINLVAYEKEDTGKKNSDTAGSVTFIIGPEGGFEPSEIAEIIETGFCSISLGKRILRAETASIYLMSLIAGAER